MAKAGFWLRGARGKLAGASAQKGQNGTILREIVTPRNPKTDKQIYQRAIMATVMKAYSAGKEIFDHAFQGVEKGQKSQQYFIAKNAPLLRSLIAQDINAIAAGTLQPTEAQNAAVAPKALYAVPGAYMVSEGTYEQSFFTLGKDNSSAIVVSIPTAIEGETIGAYAQRNGLIPGDIYTIVALAQGPNIVHNGVDMSGQVSDNVGTKQYNSVFAFIRAQVKADILTSTAAATGIIPYQLFDVTLKQNPQVGFVTDPDALVPAINDLFDQSAVISDPILGANDGSVAIIRSRLDQDLRSTSYMLVQNLSAKGFGITSPYILPTWKKGTDALGTSELILESDN